LFPVDQASEQEVGEVKVARATNPLPEATLGDLGVGARVTGLAEFPLRTLILPFDSECLTGIDGPSVRVFRVDARTRSFHTIWNSGVNISRLFAWAKIRRAGVYIAIGLPRDRLLHEILRWLVRERRYQDLESPQEMKALLERALEPYREMPVEQLEKLRTLLTQLEISTTVEPISRRDLRLSKASTIRPFPLPHDVNLAEFKKHLEKLDPLRATLPEESLFFAPELMPNPVPPWPVSPMRKTPWTSVASGTLGNFFVENMRGASLISKQLGSVMNHWLPPQDWWMYHANEAHDGNQAGASSITSQYVGQLILGWFISLDDIYNAQIWSAPAIVGYEIYIGTRSDSDGGWLYRIALFNGNILTQAYFGPDESMPIGIWHTGIGATPAVVNDKVYVPTLDGRIYCLKTADFTTEWVTNLRHADPNQNQPVENIGPNGGGATCWTSPLVVNGKVYVGVGLGEDPDPGTYGFIYCLDANNGKVKWLFCTNKFPNVQENEPNDIPPSLLKSPLPQGSIFTNHKSDPLSRGASVWSSCAYDRQLNRIYVGTGNPNPDGPLPNDPYSSGVLSLHAGTGKFKGFFQPDVSDSYRPTDQDIDMPSSPTLFTREDGQRVLAIGSKNGSLFLLDPDTMTVLAKRQLLPYYWNKNTMKEDSSYRIPTVDTEAINQQGENHSGMYGSAAVDYVNGHLFVGLGGWSNPPKLGIDSGTTPFVRTVHWDTLHDAWPTVVNVVNNNNVLMYNIPNQPMYQTPLETALSSPAVVNDVVFVTTNKPALYAFNTKDGTFLWSAPGLPQAPPGGVQNMVNIGPAIYGNYVVIGCGQNLYVYSFTPPPPYLSGKGSKAPLAPGEGSAQ
jgi:outer membrane protein assembly factor BamB